MTAPTPGTSEDGARPARRRGRPPSDALSRAVEGLDTAAFDCVQVNAAVLADALHGPQTHLRLGARLRFTPRTAVEAELPTVAAPLSEQVTALGAPLGLDLSLLDATDSGQGLLAAVPWDGRPLYAVSDAYVMPWLPYHRHQHMDHSLLLRALDDGERIEVVDAYDNDTPFGRADPVACVFERRECAALFDGVRTLPVAVQPVPLPVVEEREILDDNAAHAADLLAGDAVERYTAAFRDHPDREQACAALLLETWLLNRSRRLHAGWTARHGTDPRHLRRTAEQAASWDELAGQCYLAMRRVQRGRSVPEQIHDRLAELLTADLVLAIDAAGARRQAS